MEAWRKQLYHTGIPGMRWGVRNGPPYPLGIKDMSASERRERKDNSQKKKKGLTDKQKRTIAIAAGALIAGYAGYKLYKNGTLDKFISIGQNKVKELASEKVGDITGIDDSIKLDSSFKLTSANAASCAANVNPSGSSTNCGSVATATLLNANGGNYQALPEVPEHMRITLSDGTKGNGYDPNKLIECFEGAKWSEKITDQWGSRKKVTRQLEQNLLSQGEGSSGIFYCEKIRTRNSGHYFCWSIIDGKVHVLEGQPKSVQKTGIDYCRDLYQQIGQLFDLEDGNKSVYFARLDNCPIKPERAKDIIMTRT